MSGPAANAAGPIVIHGAGSIGAYVGLSWQLAGGDVRLLGRPWLAEAAQAAGHLALSDYAGHSAEIAAAELHITSDPAVLGEAGLVVLAIKATALDGAIAELKAHCPSTTPIVALQNGIGPLEALRAALPDHQVFGGVVTHNVVVIGGARFHKATAGNIVVEASPALGLLETIAHSRFAPVAFSHDFAAVRWGKLLINLNNAVNAASGMGLRAQFLDPKWRKMTVGAIREGMKVARAEGIHPAPTGVVSPQRLALMLSLPQWLLKRLPLLAKIDAKARSSMADDVTAGKPTEIAFLNGAIVDLGRRHGIATPVNDDLVARIGAMRGLASPEG
ncbi:2-dehydropantoate 2-reductase [Sphingorhabdus soli]|uniref:2-dehydropantoate 2-reductase n=1 Tax=Flavisphingopyxis soli TaxID=2601267 RepID=A0A5C6UNN6_9SPHN|nr:2-dehydropantoate 2-reductase [Sphingorhabdus soli]TXC74220.1 2-dehydropantoate 2-reductase [Sphingorhabdus soli]